jgi:hypothetical protein
MVSGAQVLEDGSADREDASSRGGGRGGVPSTLPHRRPTPNIGGRSRGHPTDSTHLDLEGDRFRGEVLAEAAAARAFAFPPEASS